MRYDVRMIKSSKFVNRDSDAFTQLLRPLQTARHGSHVLVDRHCPSLNIDCHLFIIQSLHVVQLCIKQFHDHLVVGLKVFLDDGSLQNRA